MADEIYSAEVRVALKGQAAILAAAGRIEGVLKDVAASTAEFDVELNKAGRDLEKITGQANRSSGAIEKVGAAQKSAAAGSQSLTAGLNKEAAAFVTAEGASNRLATAYSRAQVAGATLAPSQAAIAGMGQFATQIGLLEQKYKSLYTSAATYASLGSGTTTKLAQQKTGFNLTPISNAEASAYSNFATKVGLIGQKYQALAASEAEATAATNGQAAAQDRAATATERAAISQRALHQSLSTTKYALYDVSRSLGAWSIGLLAIPTLSAVVAAKYQRDFANVERTTLVTGKAANKLKADLIDLTTQIPVSFKEVTEIASLGGQLGVPTSGLKSFTRVVAELDATTNLTADSAGTLLGKFNSIGGVPVAKFKNLASAVLNVGVHTAATESQIAKTATQIVGIGKSAGFTTPQIVGLAGALASVSTTGPELSRGTVTRFITNMQRSVREGGTSLEAFAKTAGVSTQEVQESFGTSKFGPVFQKFIKGLHDVQTSGGDAIKVLNDMGITSVRDVPLLLNLANGWKVLNTSMDQANKGWESGASLAQHYAKINGTLIASLKETGNTLLATFNDMGGFTSGPLKSFVDGIRDAATGYRDFVKTPGGAAFTDTLLAAALALGTITLVGAGVAKVGASLIALKQASLGLAAFSGKFAAAVGLETVALKGEAAAADTATASNNRFKLSMRNLITVGAVAAVVVGGNLFDHWAAGVVAGRKSTDDFTKDLSGKASTWKKTINDALNTKVYGVVAPLGGAASQYKALFGSLDGKGFGPMKGIIDGLRGLWGVGGAFDLALAGNPLVQFQDNISNLDGAMAKLAKSGNTTQAAAEYNYLTQKLKDAGYGSKQIAEMLPKSSEAIKASADKAEKAIKQLAETTDTSKSFLTGLSAATGESAGQIAKFSAAYTKSVQPLTDMNSIIGQVQTSLQGAAQAQADLYNTNKAKDADSKSAADFYDGQSVSLQQYTDQLTANNQSQLTWAQNLSSISSSLGPDIAQQFIQAGYSATSASILQQLVDQAGGPLAQQYVEASRKAAQLAADATGQAILSSPYLTDGQGNPISKGLSDAFIDGLTRGVPVELLMQQLGLRFNANPAAPKIDPNPAEQGIDLINEYANSHPSSMIVYSNTGPSQAAIDYLVSHNDGRRINIFVATNTGGSVLPGQTMVPQGATGGLFTRSRFKFSGGGGVFGPGTGTSDNVPAWLSNGEFVIKAKSVQAVGLANLHTINRYGKLPQSRAMGGPISSRPFASAPQRITVNAPAAQSAAAPVQLSPYDRMLLQTIADNIGVVIPQSALVSATRAANVSSTNRRAA